MRGIGSSPRPWFAKHWRTLEPYDYVRTAVALVLLLGGAAKLHQLVFNPASLAIQGGLLASKWAVIAVVEAEFFLAVCLLFNLWWRATWVATLLLFCVFSVYSATKAFAGEPCGCFGAFGGRVPAWVTLVIDLVVVATLCLCRSSATSSHTSAAEPRCRARESIVLAQFSSHSTGGEASPIVCALVVPLITSLLIAFPWRANGHGISGFEIVDGRYAVIRPGQWTGSELPLLDYIEDCKDLSTGDWILFFYHHDCPKCAGLLDQLPRQMDVLTSDSALRIAVIEVPPFGERPVLPSPVSFGRLNDGLVWFVPTPLRVILSEGRVRRSEVLSNNAALFAPSALHHRTISPAPFMTRR